MIALEAIFGIVFIEPFSDEGDIALVCGRYLHDRLSRTGGLALESLSRILLLADCMALPWSECRQVAYISA